MCRNIENPVAVKSCCIKWNCQHTDQMSNKIIIHLIHEVLRNASGGFPEYDERLKPRKL